MAIATGFGEIMGEVGLLMGFGVLIGAMLHVMGAFRKMVTRPSPSCSCGTRSTPPRPDPRPSGATWPGPAATQPPDRCPSPIPPAATRQ